MTTVLQASNDAIAELEAISPLTRYYLLPQLLRENIIDRAIANVTYTSAEASLARENFYLQNQLTSETARESWAERHGITLEQLAALALRDLKIEKFKQATWSHRLESYFLKRKGQLDQAIYSLLRTRDAGIALELYFRILEGEQTFAEAAKQHSQGCEAQAGGLCGLCELGHLPPTLAQILKNSQPGQLWSPLRMGEWMVVVRLEQIVPAQLDEAMRQRLLNELFEQWLQKELSQLNDRNSI
jgi:parvulin-like peptidyl-prolyl isomerase